MLHLLALLVTLQDKIKLKSLRDVYEAAQADFSYIFGQVKLSWQQKLTH